MSPSKVLPYLVLGTPQCWLPLALWHQLMVAQLLHVFDREALETTRRQHVASAILDGQYVSTPISSVLLSSTSFPSLMPFHGLRQTQARNHARLGMCMGLCCSTFHAVGPGP